MGSGKYWLKHIKKHSASPITIELWSFDEQDDCENFALRFSKDNDIVSSRSWDNLMEERGKPGGNGLQKMTEESKEKRIATCFLRYGVDNPLKNIDIQTKAKKTNLQKYGVENPFQSDEVKSKIRDVMLTTYGVANPSQSKEVKEKKEETFLRNYGVTHWAKTKEAREKKRLNAIKQHQKDKPRTCPHCSLTGKGGNMSRYHFDNCLKRKNQTD